MVIIIVYTWWKQKDGGGCMNLIMETSMMKSMEFNNLELTQKAV